MKRHFLLYSIFTIISIFAWGNSTISSDYINFSPLRNLIQLPTNEVRNLFQDKEGYIWIATYNGLVRYDGYSTKVYHAEPDGGENRLMGSSMQSQKITSAIYGLAHTTDYTN